MVAEGERAAGEKVSEKTVAKIMMGTAAKKEYSVAVFRSTPEILPPRMVDAARDMPGHSDRH